MHVLRPAHGMRLRAGHGSEVKAAHHASPFEDETVEQLEPAARAAVGELWRSRAASELRVGARFAQIRQALSPSARPEVLASLTAAVGDETRHSELCARVAARYAPALPPFLPPPPEPPLVRFGDADEPLSLLLHLVLQSCLNESTSTVYLRDAMKLCRPGLARETLRQLLSDDVEHARLGWAHLASASVSGTDRQHVARALPALLRVSAGLWTDVPERSEPWFGEHGCAGRAVARAAFESAAREIVLPGMAHVGVSPEYGTAWLSKRCR